MIKSFNSPIKRSKQVEDWIKDGGIIKIIPSKKSAAKLNKISGGYFKSRYVNGPSKKTGKYA
jgi:hypothetical protein